MDIQSVTLPREKVERETGKDDKYLESGLTINSFRVIFDGDEAR